MRKHLVGPTRCSKEHLSICVETVGTRLPAPRWPPKPTRSKPRLRSPFPTSAEAVSCQGPEMSWALDRLGAGRALPSLPWSEPPDSGTCFYRDAKGSDQSQGPPGQPCAPGGGGCTRQTWVLGADPNPLLVPNEKVIRTLAQCSQQGRNSPPAQSPASSSAAPAGEASHCRFLRFQSRPSQRPAPEPGCLPLGHLAGLLQNTHPERGSEPAGLFRPRFPEVPLPSLEAGLVPLGETANSQPSNHGKERLQ